MLCDLDDDAQKFLRREISLGQRLGNGQSKSGVNSSRCSQASGYDTSLGWYHSGCRGLILSSLML